MDGGQDPSYGVDAAVQAELTDVDGPGELGQGLSGQGVAGPQHRQGQGQVEPGTRLGQVCRGEVDGQTLLPPAQAAGGQGGTHPLPRLPDGGVGQPYQGEAGQAGRGVGLDVHQVAVQAGEGDSEGPGEAHPSPTPSW